MKQRYRIDVGERAIWVNDEFCCLGRFGRLGVDVHKALGPDGMPLDGSKDGTECLCCTHGPTGWAEWDLFRIEMRNHHGVTISDDIVPGWLTPTQARCDA